jgi:hypothetical protein
MVVGKSVGTADALWSEQKNSLAAVTGSASATNAQNRNRMSSAEAELKGLMMAALNGDERAYREAFAVTLSLLLAPMPDWRTMIFGQQWLLCLVCIPLNAIAPFTAMVLALRRFASPTHLARTGALAGRVSGGISAFVYALHCTDDSVAFVGFWYGLTIAFCTGIGALLGPRLLRW